MKKRSIMSLFSLFILGTQLTMSPLTNASDIMSQPTSGLPNEAVGESTTETVDTSMSNYEIDIIETEEGAPVPDDSAQPSPSTTEETVETTSESYSNQTEAVRSVDDLTHNPLVEPKELTNNERQSMNLRIMNYNTLSYRAVNASPTVDGATINQLTASWITPDTREDGNPNMNTQVWRDNGTKSLQLRWNFSLSGQHDYPIGTVQFSIPKHYFQDRNGRETGYLTLAVPAAPDNSGIFSYVETEDAYVLTNTKVLSAATSGVFEATIRGLTPSEIKDMSVGYKSQPFKAKLTVITKNEQTLTAESNELFAQIDTQSIVKNASKATASRYAREVYPRNWPTELKPTNPDDYVYAEWYVYCFPEGNQYYSLDLFDQPLNYGGKVLGYRTTHNNQVIKESGAIRLTKDQFPPLSNGTTGGHAVVYTAYPKAQFKHGQIYELKNEVTYTLTSTDDQEVTTATATASIPYQPIQFQYPGGHFITHKSGYQRNRRYYDYRNGDNSLYPSILNKLLDGRDEKITYSIRNTAFGMPWTLGEGLDKNELSNYGKRDYTVSVTDDRVRLEDRELKSGDYQFTDLEISKPTVYSYGKAPSDRYTYYEEDGVVKHGNVPEGYYAYLLDNNLNNQITFKISADTGSGQYREIAQVDFKGDGTAKVSGPGQSGSKVVFPAGTIHYKVEATSNMAGFTWSMIPTVELKSTPELKNILTQKMKENATPHMFALNDVRMDALLNGEWTHINSEFGRDILGSVGSGATLHKSLRYENDKRNRTAVLNYRAQASIQVNVSDPKELDQLIKDGLYTEERQTTWYDLLPVGVRPVLSSIKGRPGDQITNISVEENYRNSGRTLLKVDMNLTPVYNYRQNPAIGQPALVDEPYLDFTAYYSWENYKTFGSLLTNNVVYEGKNEKLGTIKNFIAEPDNPLAGNHINSRTATSNSPDLLTNLNPDHDRPTFIYGRNSTNLILDTYALSSLRKTVDVNGEGVFGDGLDDESPKNVFEGGNYTYQFRVGSSPDTITKDIIVYDYIDQYKPTGEKPDYKDAQWKGTFNGLNLVELKQAGVNPIVYYSTRTDLVLGVEEDQKHHDLKNTAIWSKTPPKDLSKVTAIAVDMRQRPDGAPFVLKSGENIGFYMNMRAPVVKDLTANTSDYPKWYDASSKNGEDGLKGGAHSYNNASMKSTSMQKETQVEVNQLVRHDYVKVGLKPHLIKVSKKWDDDDDRDAKRPESITVRLLANGKPTEYTASLSAKNNWEYIFKSVPRSDERGIFITYSVSEDLPEGYRMTSNKNQTEYGPEFELTNVHTPEKISIQGNKTWADDNLEVRPEQIKINVYGNNKHVRTHTVKPNAEGDWHFQIDDLFKNEKGEPIKYRLEEVGARGYISEQKGNNFHNRYYPYGDVKFTKKVNQSTPESKDNTFDFIVTLRGKDNLLDLNSYNYVTSDGRKGTISTGGTITLKENQTVTIQKINMDTTVRVSEMSKKGYILVSENNLEAFVDPGETKELTFTNEYRPTGRLSLVMNKELVGKKLPAAGFVFEIYDEQGELVRTASNDREGKIIFGFLNYERKDVGKTYTYTIKERQTNKPGYVYDESVKHLTVKITDNGDGTLKVGHAFKNNDTTFKNQYKASGKLNLVAYKEIMNGFEPEAGAFKFELRDKKTNKLVSRGTNDAAGRIDFDTITYDQTMIGKKFTLVANEVVGSDTSMIYDTSKIEYQIEVYDNGDGALNFRTTVKDLKTDDINNDPTVPIFANKFKDGSLKIQKDVAKGSPGGVFRFKVKLTGEESLIPKGKLNIERDTRIDWRARWEEMNGIRH